MPVKLNVRISVKNKSIDNTLTEFAKLHALSAQEFAAVVDELGYVKKYIKGSAHSVSVDKINKGETIFHNHPSGSAFSKQDLITFAKTEAAGVVASGKNGDYIIKRVLNSKQTLSKKLLATQH